MNNTEETKDLAAAAAELGAWWFKFEKDDITFGGGVPRDFDRTNTFFAWVEKLGGEVHTIVEFGSHEGSHSLQLASYPGVNKVIGFEGREDNFLRANFIKKVYKVENIEFIFSNIENLSLESIPKNTDALFCVGLLYHLPKPWELIEKFGNTNSKFLFIDTHYAESAETTQEKYSGSFFDEGLDPLSGLSQQSFWLTFQDLVMLLMENGFLIHYVRNLKIEKGARVWIFAEKVSCDLVTSVWSV